MSLYHHLEGARAECERRMADLADAPGSLPREWFSLNAMERRLRPLVYEAARLSGEPPPVYTRITEAGKVVS